MQSSKMSFKNMMVAPHHLAAKTGSDILKEGGNAIEAMIASAAMMSVVYPHMNSMGGDNFWLISEKNKKIERSVKNLLMEEKKFGITKFKTYIDKFFHLI